MPGQPPYTFLYRRLCAPVPIPPLVVAIDAGPARGLCLGGEVVRLRAWAGQPVVAR